MEQYKIFIEDGLSTIRKTGVGHYTEMLKDCLKQMEINVNLINKNYIVKIPQIKLRRFFYTLWLNTIFLLQLILIKGRKKVIFTNTNTPVFKIKNVEYLSVVHDLRPFKIPKQSSSKFVNYYEKRKVFKAMKRAHKIITVSETVKNEVAKYFSYPRDKINVIYNSIGTHFYHFNDNLNFLQKYNIEKEKYILTVSTRQKWKHMPLIINAFKNISDEYPDFKLVLVGKAGNDNDYIEHKNIIFTGYIADEEVAVLYRHAYCYISASEDEGFGIPLIEAQYSGVPVICSDIPIYREVCNNSAMLSALDLKTFQDNIKYIINNAEVRNKLIKTGYKNVKRFSKDVIKKQIAKTLDCSTY